jgi:hypothetical protein
MDLVLLILQLTLPLLATIAIFVDNAHDKLPTGKSPEELEKALSERRNRRVARTFGVVALLFSLFPLSISYFKDREKDIENEQRSNDQKAKLDDLLKQIDQQKKELLGETKKVEKTQTDLHTAQAELSDAQKESLKLSSTLLDVQNRGLHQLDRLSLDRTLAGIEISYTPTADEWKDVMTIYQQLVPNIEKETSYYGAPIIATRSGSYWLIDFDGVSTGPAGDKWFPAVTTEDPKNKDFEKIIRMASLPLHITWEIGVETMLEPWRDNYPSVLKLSPKRFVFILRPPLLLLDLGSLHQNSNITLRSRPPWNHIRRELTFRSLDPKVKLEQTLQLEWTKSKPSEKRQTMYPTGLYRYASGPHKLNMRFEILTR